MDYRRGHKMNYKPSLSLMQLFSRFRDNKDRSLHRARELCARYLSLGVKNERLEKELFVLLLKPQKNHLFQKLQKEIALCEGLALIAPPFKEYEVKTKENGEKIVIGLSHKNETPVLISQKDFSRHFLCVGSTGSTKTSLAKWIIVKNSHIRCAFIFSFLKEDFEELIPALLRQGRKVYVIYGEALGANILEMSPKISVAKQLSSLTQVLCEALEIPPYNKIILRNVLKKIYATKHVPTLKHLTVALREGSKEGRFLLERCEYLYESIGEDIQHGWTIDNLLDLDAIVLFQLNRLERPVQLFITKWILTQLFNYKIDNPEDDRFCSVFVDECQLVAGKNSILESTISTIRVAAGCFLMTQTPTSLSTTFIANCNTKLFGELRSLQDLDIARQYGMLTLKQMEYLKREMTPGTFMAMLPGHPEPFLVKFPYVNYPKVTNEDLRQAKLPLEGIITTEDVVIEYHEAEPVLLPDAENLLINIHESPHLKVNERCEQLGFHFKQFNKARQILLDDGYIKEVEIPLGQRGRPKLYEITKEKGKAHLIQLGYNPKQLYHGSVRHRFALDFIKGCFEKQNIPVHIEQSDSEGFIPDACVRLKSEWVPIEVVLDNHPKDQVERILRKLNHNTSMIIVFLDKKTKNSIKERLLPHVKGKSIRFSLISDFYKEKSTDFTDFTDFQLAYDHENR